MAVGFEYIVKTPSKDQLKKICERKSEQHRMRNRWGL